MSRAELGVLSKSDASPVTVADKALNARVLSALASARPSDTVVSEEDEADFEYSVGRTWWVGVSLGLLALCILPP